MSELSALATELARYGRPSRRTPQAEQYMARLLAREVDRLVGMTPRDRDATARRLGELIGHMASIAGGTLDVLDQHFPGTSDRWLDQQERT